MSPIVSTASKTNRLGGRIVAGGILAIAIGIFAVIAISSQTKTIDNLAQTIQEKSAAYERAALEAMDYVIVTPDDADEPEAYAAQELQNYLEQMTSKRLKISSEKDSPNGKRILIGDTEAGRDIAPDEELKPLGPEGFIVRVGGTDLALRGGSPRGSLYSVYSLLEDSLGVRWFALDETHIPKLENLSAKLDGLNYSQKPGFEYRESYFFHTFDGDFAARNRLNGHHHELQAKHGGKEEYLNWFVHSFRKMMPPEEFFDAHPEYFSMRSGRRVPDAQLCLTNPEALKIITDRTLKLAETAGGKRAIITVSQMDNVYPCTCEKCKLAYEADGGTVGTYMKFVNAVADAVAAKFPNISISTLAYNFTEAPSTKVLPRPNVIVRLCHMAPSCDTHPLGSCLLNSRFVQNMKGWKALTDRIYVWHYITVFHNYLMPYPNLNAMAKDFAFYRDNGVKGIFAQGNGQSYGGDVAELKAWLAAKLLWNPDADALELIKEFVNGYYGPAAPAMMKYIGVQQKQARRPNIHASLYAEPTAGYMDGPLLRKMDEALSEAEKLADGDPKTARRVDRERLAYMYAQIAAPQLFDPEHFTPPADPAEREAMFRRFEEKLKTHNITRLHELETMEESLGRLKQGFLEM